MSDDTRIQPIELEVEMKRSYLDYSMSVIVSRALPDVRDGLKPVHRRILYSMYEQKLTHQRAFKKSATVVGDVLGKYHPHGDSSVYDAMVRMAQGFSLRHPLVDGQGNFGSMDGDPAAAYRYTEARMASIGEEMLRDIDQQTVDFQPNFDQRLSEPTVLPSGFPNLLVNGSSGIAVGMATNIPPHNLREIIEALLLLIEDPHTGDEQLLGVVKGPDFPTGARIMGTGGIRKAYMTGHGRIVIRAVSHIETVSGRECIIVTEIPYQVNKARLIESIADLVKDKKLTGIADLRDESDREGTRIVIVLKREAIADVVLNQLYKHSAMELSFGANMLALVDQVPKRLTLRRMLELYIEHRHEVILRRCRFQLEKAEARAHILEGLLIAQDNIDEVVRIIRGSATQEVAKTRLMETFGLSELQAQAILEMRLGRLTALDRDSLRQELEDLMVLIGELRVLLASRQARLAVVAEELRQVSEKWGDDRRTSISPHGVDNLEDEDMVPDDPMVIMLSHKGYIKRLSIDTWQSQNRGGRGKTGVITREEDFLDQVFTASNHTYILFFTNQGRCYWLKVFRIPEAGRNTLGKALVNLVELNPGERPVARVCVNDFTRDAYIAMVTSEGMVKKSPLVSYSRPRKGGIKAVRLSEGSELVSALMTTGNDHLLIGTARGKAIHFSETEIRPLSRDTLGVRGISLGSGDRVVGMTSVTPGDRILTVTRNGYGKFTPASAYRTTHRGGLGIKNVSTGDRNGEVVVVGVADSEDEILLVSAGGIAIRLRAEDVREIGRNTMGVKLMSLSEGDRVSDAAILSPESLRKCAENEAENEAE
jgi:DNA gyrase subunit A